MRVVDAAESSATQIFQFSLSIGRKEKPSSYFN